MQIQSVARGRADDGGDVWLIEARIDPTDTATLAALAEYEARLAAGTSPPLTADPARDVAVPVLAAIVAAGQTP
jgi:hypothetical protein